MYQYKAIDTFLSHYENFRWKFEKSDKSVSEEFEKLTISNVVSTKTMPLNTWVHLAFTYESSNLIIYINGVFEKSTWTELVGQFYDNQTQEGKHLLTNHLQPQKYQFTKLEYEDLENKIEQGYDLYNDLNTLKHPLRVLNNDIFTEKTHTEASAFTFDTVDEILNEISALYNKYVVALAGYSEELGGYVQLDEGLPIFESIIDAINKI